MSRRYATKRLLRVAQTAILLDKDEYVTAGLLLDGESNPPPPPPMTLIRDASLLPLAFLCLSRLFNQLAHGGNALL